MHFKSLAFLHSSRKLQSFCKRIIPVCVVIILLYVIFRRQRNFVAVLPPVPGFIVRSLRNQSIDGGVGSKDIPKIIHQTWKARDRVPETFRPWMESWIKLNSNWDYWFWTDEDMRVFMSTVFPEYLSLYDSYPNQFYRADAFRYFLLYSHGGVYADIDMECLHPLDGIVQADDCVISQEPLEHAHFLSSFEPPLVSNALMACRPHHPFFEYAIDHLKSYTGFLFWNDILHATGPLMLTKVFEKYHLPSYFGYKEVTNSVRLASPEEFQPHPDDSMIDHMRKMCQNAQGRSLPSETFAQRQKTLCNKLLAHDFGRSINPNSLTNHHWTHTWAGKLHDPWGVHNMRLHFPVSDLLSVRRQ